MSGAAARTVGPVILVTCEHGGNRVPPEVRDSFVGAGDVLASHRGWDAGALPLAEELSAHLGAPLRSATVSRLVVDLNRSPHHPRVLSEFTRPLPRSERERLLRLHHTPYRGAVDGDVSAALATGRGVLHLGVHTFTPVFEGEIRRADLALLYDPPREAERHLAARWVTALQSELPGLAVRRNQPYRGASDGLTTWLRARHGERYLGIEIEVNQRWLDGSARFPTRFAAGLARSLDRVLGHGVPLGASGETSASGERERRGGPQPPDPALS